MKCPICFMEHNPITYNVSGMEFNLLPCDKVVPDVCHLFQADKIAVSHQRTTITQEDLNYIAQGMRYEKSDS